MEHYQLTSAGTDRRMKAAHVRPLALWRSAKYPATAPPRMPPTSNKVDMYADSSSDRYSPPTAPLSWDEQGKECCIAVSSARKSKLTHRDVMDVEGEPVEKRICYQFGEEEGR
eukprot:scaffold7214_cov410-Prasinococcus_capsulatus_cf.AAC.13